MTTRPSTDSLNRRRREILEAVVRLHIETGRPVSSGLVERSLQRAVSSATIRSEMKVLEETGYLEQPHTSAGRLPTDAGFRVFVDALSAGWSLRRHEAPAELRALAGRDIRDSLGAQDRWKVLAGVLSRLTANISVIVGPSRAAARIERVELYPRTRTRGLMVVLLDNSHVRTGLVDLPDESGAVLAEAVRLLNERVAGLTLAAVRDEALPTLDLVHTPVTACAGRVARAGRDLLTAPLDDEVEVDGVGHVLAVPELQEPGPLQALLRVMEAPGRIGRTLREAMRGADDGFGVWIGEENPIEQLQSFSVLTGDFRVDGHEGVLAVIGPRRMSYQRAFHGIDILREALTCVS